MFPSKRILVLGSVISLPLIYGKVDFGKQLDKYLFDPVYPTDNKKKLYNFKDKQNKFLRYTALMQLYACGAPRKANDEFESSDSVLDCSEYFKDPKSLKSEFEAIWEQGGKESQVDRGEVKGLSESSVRQLLEQLKKQSEDPETAKKVRKLLTSVRPHFSRCVDVEVPLDDDDKTMSCRKAMKILKQYEEQYDMVVHRYLESSLYFLDRYLISPDEEALGHFKYAREEILLGLVMMDLYTCGNGQKTEAHEDRSLCSTIHSTIIKSKSQPVTSVTSEILKVELLKVVNEGWKASELDRNAEYKRGWSSDEPPVSEPRVIGLKSDKSPSLRTSYLALYHGQMTHLDRSKVEALKEKFFVSEDMLKFADSFPLDKEENFTPAQWYAIAYISAVEELEAQLGITLTRIPGTLTRIPGEDRDASEKKFRLHWSTISVENENFPLKILNKRHVYTLIDLPENAHIVIRTTPNESINWTLVGIDIEGSNVLPQLVSSAAEYTLYSFGKKINSIVIDVTRNEYDQYYEALEVVSISNSRKKLNLSLGSNLPLKKRKHVEQP